MESWVKTKCWDVGDFELLGIKREPGKPAAAIMARGGRYARTAAVTLPGGLRDVEWVKPGITGRVRFLRGEHTLRHATLQDFEEGT